MNIYLVFSVFTSLYEQNYTNYNKLQLSEDKNVRKICGRFQRAASELRAGHRAAGADHTSSKGQRAMSSILGSTRTAYRIVGGESFWELSTGMRRITTFRSTTDRIHDGGPIRL